MALSILDVRIGQIGVEASRAALDGQAPGPLGGLGSGIGYETLFEAARARADGLALPWLSDKPYSNRFWRKYVTDRMLTEAEESWPAISRGALVPIKAPAPLPVVHLHPAEVRSYSEAYAWPSAVGIVWNTWIRPETDVEGLVDVLDKLRNGEVAWSGADGVPGLLSMQNLYHQMLDTARAALWETKQAGIRSKPLTIVSIVQGSAPPLPDKAAETARETLLEGIGKSWGERPAPLPGDKRAATGAMRLRVPGSVAYCFVSDLHQPRDFTFADVGNAAAEDIQHRFDRLEHLARAGHRDGQLACGDHLRVAADRRGEEIAAVRVRRAADQRAGLGWRPSRRQR